MTLGGRKGRLVLQTLGFYCMSLAGSLAHLTAVCRALTQSSCARVAETACLSALFSFWDGECQVVVANSDISLLVFVITWADAPWKYIFPFVKNDTAVTVN